MLRKYLHHVHSWSCDQSTVSIYLGASPGGFTGCECCGDGIIEIKCPFSVQDGKPEELIGRKGSFLNDAGLIHSHKYYTQVQGQLEICRKTFCCMDIKLMVCLCKGIQGPTVCGKHH